MGNCVHGLCCKYSGASPESVPILSVETDQSSLTDTSPVSHFSRIQPTAPPLEVSSSDDSIEPTIQRFRPRQNIIFEEEITDSSDIFNIDEECGICFFEYDENKHFMEILPCGHVLCLACALRIKIVQDEGIVLECYLCKKQHKIIFIDDRYPSHKFHRRRTDLRLTQDLDFLRSEGLIRGNATSNQTHNETEENSRQISQYGRNRPNTRRNLPTRDTEEDSRQVLPNRRYQHNFGGDSENSHNLVEPLPNYNCDTEGTPRRALVTRRNQYRRNRRNLRGTQRDC